ncbi:MAG: CvpA family protein [Candidatus Cloacimonadaceae bacterium]|jgi:uncharacterized membrane protein required for colicin V production
MGVIDWIILAVILFCMFWGWRRGFTASLIYLGALIFNFYFLGQLYPLLAGTIRVKYNLPPFIATIVAIFFVVILIVVVAKIMITLLNAVLKALKLSSINRFFGLLLGLLNGALIVILVMVMIDHAPKLAKSLKDPQKHKVYVQVDRYKDVLLERLKLTQHEKYLQLKERFKLDKANKDEKS